MSPVLRPELTKKIQEIQKKGIIITDTLTKITTREVVKRGIVETESRVTFSHMRSIEDF